MDADSCLLRWLPKMEMVQEERNVTPIVIYDNDLFIFQKMIKDAAKDLNLDYDT